MDVETVLLAAFTGCLFAFAAIGLLLVTVRGIFNAVHVGRMIARARRARRAAQYPNRLEGR